MRLIGFLLLEHSVQVAPRVEDLDPSPLQSIKNLSSDGAGAGGGVFL